jgi:hypothetical protein
LLHPHNLPKIGPGFKKSARNKKFMLFSKIGRRGGSARPKPNVSNIPPCARCCCSDNSPDTFNDQAIAGTAASAIRFLPCAFQEWGFVFGLPQTMSLLGGKADIRLCTANVCF